MNKCIFIGRLVNDPEILISRSLHLNNYKYKIKMLYDKIKLLL